MKDYDVVKAKVAEVSEYLPKIGGVVKVPIDLGIILKKYGIRALDATFKKSEISGAFERKTKTILLDETDPYTRKMFTLAHELGHYFLHQDIVTDIVYRERTKGKRAKLEKQADEFAAELLMPEAAIRLFWPVTSSVQQLAGIFSVSYVAMLNRLRHLGFI